MNRRVARSLTMGTISRRCSENSSYAWFAGNVAVPEFRNASNDGIRRLISVPSPSTGAANLSLSLSLVTMAMGQQRCAA